MPVRLDLRDLTLGERVWLARRRLGLTQAQMGKRLGVKRGAIWGAERGLRTPGWAEDLAGRTRPPGVLQEALPLARRRSGKTLRQAAALAGVTHVKMLDLEGSGSEDLMEFWARRGFRF